MNDPRSGKRKHLASVERNKMLARYNKECVDKPLRMETEEERKARLLKKWAKEKYEQSWKLHYEKTDNI